MPNYSQTPAVHLTEVEVLALQEIDWKLLARDGGRRDSRIGPGRRSPVLHSDEAIRVRNSVLAVSELDRADNVHPDPVHG